MLAPNEPAAVVQSLSHVQLFGSVFILSGVISPLISNSILDTYQPEKFIFQCPIFLPFHTVHGAFKARILKWFAIPFSSGPVFSELSTMTCPSWVALHSMLIVSLS